MALRKLGEGLVTWRVKLKGSKESRIFKVRNLKISEGLELLDIENALITAVGWGGLGGEMVRRILEPTAPKVRLPEPVIRP